MGLFLSPSGSLSPLGSLLLFGLPLILLEYKHRHLGGALFYLGVGLLAPAAVLLTAWERGLLGPGGGRGRGRGSVVVYSNYNSCPTYS